MGNPNDWEDITLTSLADVVDNGGACTVAAGPYVVPKSGSLDVNYSCSYASAPSSYSWHEHGDGDLGQGSCLHADWLGQWQRLHAGTAGCDEQDRPCHRLVGGDLGTVTATDGAPFATATFTYDRTESGVAGTCTSYDNTATITETKQSASKTVTVCVGKDLTVTKTAAAPSTVTYLWKISKDVDKTLVKIAEGGSYTFNYTVGVAQTGISDSGWTLSGKITVTQPERLGRHHADQPDRCGGQRRYLHGGCRAVRSRRRAARWT